MSESKQTSLKSALKKHYQQKTLSEDKLDKLLALQQESALEPLATSDLDSDRSYSPQAKRSWMQRAKGSFLSCFNFKAPVYALASVSLFALIITLMPMPVSGPSILAEIASHHQQPSSINIKSSSISEIGNQLSKLSFALIHSSKLSSDVWEFLGGSYCSINGELSAQLKVFNREENKIYTFYQAEYPDELMLDAAISSITNEQGTEVSIWKEEGLLLGLAHTSH